MLNPPRINVTTFLTYYKMVNILINKCVFYLFIQDLLEEGEEDEFYRAIQSFDIKNYEELKVSTYHLSLLLCI